MPSENTLTLNRRKQANSSARPKSKKPKAWSHHDYLKSIIGKEVCVVLASGAFINGELQECDQFTVMVEGVVHFKGQLESITLKDEQKGA